MELNANIKAALAGSNALNGFVLSSIAKVDSFISGRGTYFFPEYTDHGLEHIESVINTAVGLTSAESTQRLNANDWTTLTLAATLHDLGMHVSRAGFESLIMPDSVWKGVPEFNDESWDRKWNDFFSSAQRFNAKELERVLGKNARLPRELPGSTAPWDEFDILLVGEFLRRNHSRLAHDIALYGFPGVDGKCEPILQTSGQNSEHLHDLIGLVARSHGIPLRDCIDYLDLKYGNHVDPRQVCAIYLMVLLRISDAFQIQASRARLPVSSITKFRSPFSSQEWRVHQSIEDINNSSSDPEALSIFCSPKDVNTFLRIKSWKDSLQTNLDTSWAVLGEVYGRMPIEGLGALALRIRRVKTNIDNVSNFAEKVSYLPERLNFTASSPELLSLLVAPLYGGDRSVGIRELMQNSIDAVKELEDFIANGIVIEGSRRLSDCGVKLSIVLDSNNDPEYVHVEDAGCGMTSKIIQNFFLRAGASFRQSEEWQKQHESGKGQSRISRGGRFGVGALAAFLLGDEIEVTTRHYSVSEDQGLHFKATIESEALNIERVKAPVGTIVSVKLSSAASRILKRNKYQNKAITSVRDNLCWFFQKSPSLKIFYGDENISVASEILIPDDSDSSTPPWARFESAGYTVFWQSEQNGSSAYVNGIYVGSANDASFDAQFFNAPTFSVIDKAGTFPLNLQRNRIDLGKLPFEPSLSESMVDAFIAHALLNYQWKEGSFYPRIPRYSGSRKISYERQRQLWLPTNKGLLLNTATMLQAFGLQHVIVCVGEETKLAMQEISMLDDDSCVVEHSVGVFAGKANEQKGVVGQYLLAYGSASDQLLHGKQIVDCVSAISRAGATYIEGLSPGVALSEALRKLTPVEEKQAVLYTQGKVHVSLANFVSLQAEGEKWLLARVSVSDREARDLNFPMYRWKEVLDDLLIPYDDEARSALVQRADALIPDAMNIERWHLASRRKRIETSESAETVAHPI